MVRSCCTTKVVAYSVLITGIIVVCLGAGFQPLFQKIFEDGVKKKLVMKEGTEAFDNWNSPPNPIFVEYYFFNYTTVQNFLKNGKEPIVEQLGPYVYEEHRLNYVLNSTDDEITYTQNYTYIFNEERSCEMCTENDVIQTPSISILTIFQLFMKANTSTAAQKTIVEIFANVLASQEFLPFHNLKVSELLWGYTDPFVIWSKKNQDTIEGFLKQVGLKVPVLNPFIALQHNGTDEAEYIGNVTIKTGNKNINEVQRVIRWRGLTTTPHWNNMYGDMINGTDGTHFKPLLDKTHDDKLDVFITDICRSVTLSYENDQTLRDISLYRYSQSAAVFANSTINPDNIAFCVEKCWKSGIVPVGQCIEGNPPIFMSQPHFYQGDPSLVNSIKGMKPDKQLHETVVDVEPITGIMMGVRKRLQLNILISRNPLLSPTNNFRQNQTFLPIMYLAETMTLNEKNADKFKHEVYQPRYILKWSRYGLYIIGGVLFLVAVVMVIFLKTKHARSGYQQL